MVCKYGGMGFGLFICSEFVKLLGGWIFLSSEVGKGSMFIFYFFSFFNGFVDYKKVNFVYEEVVVFVEEVEFEVEIIEIDYFI